MKEFQIISRHEKISAVYSNQINKIINFNKLRIKFLKGHIYLIVKLLIMKKYYSNFTKLVGDVAFLFGLQKIFGIILFKFKKRGSLRVHLIILLIYLIAILIITYFLLDGDVFCAIIHISDAKYYFDITLVI